MPHADVAATGLVGNHIPIMGQDGTWLQRSASSSEAGAWLRSILKRGGYTFDRLTGHSLKSTTLAWCSKFGIARRARLQLIHQSTGDGTINTYARDFLAPALATYVKVLGVVRTGSFFPDLTRSGRFADGATFSSESSSSESDANPDLVAEFRCDLAQPSQAWKPGFDVFRRIRTQVVRLRAKGSFFACGRKSGSDYEKIDASIFLEVKKCKSCEAADPLRHEGALAKALSSILEKKRPEGCSGREQQVSPKGGRRYVPLV